MSKINNKNSTIKRVLLQIRPYLPTIILLLALAVVSVLCSLYIPVLVGDAIDAMHAAAADNQKTIMVTHLSAFCFGDIYTRRGLDLKERELLTFSVISALGGCESQVKSHVQGNVSAGNDKNDLIAALETALPLIGFPRTLNALSCVNAVLPD